ncbi:MAG: hypothetical protein ABIQ31_15005 [Ferruginibacter sp.]
METTEFKEVQGFRVWWAWAAVIALNSLFIYAIIQQVVLGIPFGPEPASNLLLSILAFASLSMLYFLYSIKLRTIFNDRGIEYRFYPFQTKSTFIEWSELSDAYMREYNSFYEYGGWGIRVGAQGNSRAINTSASGNEGLQLEFKDGKLLLIGTKKPEEIKRIVDIQIAAGKIRWGM